MELESTYSRWGGEIYEWEASHEQANQHSFFTNLRITTWEALCVMGWERKQNMTKLL